MRRKRVPVVVIALMALALAGSQCVKQAHVIPDNPYGLPNVGQPGMGCMLDSTQYISILYDLQAQLIGDTLLGVEASGYGPYYEDFGIGVKTNVKSFQVGVPLPIDSTANCFIQYLTDSTCVGFNNTATDAFAVSGSITIISLDLVNSQVVGTFQCKIPIPGCDTLQVSYGRFDINFYRQ